MRPTGMVIELRCGDLPTVAAFGKKCQGVRRIFYQSLFKILDEHPLLSRVVEYLQPSLLLVRVDGVGVGVGAFGHGLSRSGWGGEVACEKIAQLFVVKLNKRYFDTVIRSIGFEVLE